MAVRLAQARQAGAPATADDFFLLPSTQVNVPLACTDADGGSEKALTSRFRGVCWNRKNKRWQAAINSSGRYVYLGSFLSEEEAARAFDRAAIKLRGKRAKLNFTYSDYLDGEGNLQDDPKLKHAMDKIQAITTGKEDGGNGSGDGGDGALDHKDADDPGGVDSDGPEGCTTQQPKHTITGAGGSSAEPHNALGGKPPAGADAGAKGGAVGGVLAASAGIVRPTAQITTSLNGTTAAPGVPAHPASAVRKQHPAIAGSSGNTGAVQLGAPRLHQMQHQSHQQQQQHQQQWQQQHHAAASLGRPISQDVFKHIQRELPPGAEITSIVPNRFANSKEEMCGALYLDPLAPQQTGSAVWTGASIIKMGLYDTERDAKQAAVKCMQLYWAFCSDEWRVDFYNALGTLGVQQQQQQGSQGAAAGGGASASAATAAAAAGSSGGAMGLLHGGAAAGASTAGASGRPYSQSQHHHQQHQHQRQQVPPHDTEVSGSHSGGGQLELGQYAHQHHHHRHHNNQEARHSGGSGSSEGLGLSGLSSSMDGSAPRAGNADALLSQHQQQQQQQAVALQEQQQRMMALQPQPQGHGAGMMMAHILQQGDAAGAGAGDMVLPLELPGLPLPAGMRRGRQHPHHQQGMMPTMGGSVGLMASSQAAAGSLMGYGDPDDEPLPDLDNGSAGGGGPHNKRQRLMEARDGNEGMVMDVCGSAGAPGHGSGGNGNSGAMVGVEFRNMTKLSGLHMSDVLMTLQQQAQQQQKQQ